MKNGPQKKEGGGAGGSGVLTDNACHKKTEAVPSHRYKFGVGEHVGNSPKYGRGWRVVMNRSHRPLTGSGDNVLYSSYALCVWSKVLGVKVYDSWCDITA